MQTKGKRYNFTAARMAVTKDEQNERVGKDVDRLDPSYTAAVWQFSEAS